MFDIITNNTVNSMRDKDEIQYAAKILSIFEKNEMRTTNCNNVKTKEYLNFNKNQLHEFYFNIINEILKSKTQ